MVSKKEAVILAALAVGGIGLAAAVHGGGDTTGGGGLGMPMSAMPTRTGGILGSQEGYGYTPKIDQAPAQPAVMFPDPPDYKEVFDRFFMKPEIPESRGAAGVSAASKKEASTGVIYGGYKPSGKSYVFGGRAFEAQAAREVVSGGWSPTLAASFGFSSDISSGGTAPKKTQFDRLPSGCSASSGGKGDSGTALPGRPYISKKPM